VLGLYFFFQSRPKCRGTQGVRKLSRNFVGGLWAKDKKHSDKKKRKKKKIATADMTYTA
jgi:hypothetical protein